MCKHLDPTSAPAGRGNHHQLQGQGSRHCFSHPPAPLLGQPQELQDSSHRANVATCCYAQCQHPIILSSCSTVDNSNCGIPRILTIPLSIIMPFLALALACLGKITQSFTQSLCFIFLHQEDNIIVELHYVTVLWGHNMSNLEAEHLPPSRIVLHIIISFSQCLLPQTQCPSHTTSLLQDIQSQLGSLYTCSHQTSNSYQRIF